MPSLWSSDEAPETGAARGDVFGEMPETVESPAGEPKKSFAEFRKEKQRAERLRLIERLDEEGAHDLASQLAKCGRVFKLVCTHCGAHHAAETRCKKRWCAECAPLIARDRVARYREIAYNMKWPLFVTLTIKNTPNPNGLKEIKKMWANLRRRKLIREKVAGGIIGWEITNKGRGWHPHCHALLDCRWLSLHVPEPTRTDPQNRRADKCRAAAMELEALWAEIAGQPSASVRARRGDAQALVEVLKYSVKGSDLAECEEPVAPLIRLMAGMRLMTTFGSCHGKNANPEADEDEKGGMPCPECGSVGAWVTEEVANILTRSS